MDNIDESWDVLKETWKRCSHGQCEQCVRLNTEMIFTRRSRRLLAADETSVEFKAADTQVSQLKTKWKNHLEDEKEHIELDKFNVVADLLEIGGHALTDLNHLPTQDALDKFFYRKAYQGFRDNFVRRCVMFIRPEFLSERFGKLTTFDEAQDIKWDEVTDVVEYLKNSRSWCISDVCDEILERNHDDIFRTWIHHLESKDDEELPNASDRKLIDVKRMFTEHQVMFADNLHFPLFGRFANYFREDVSLPPSSVPNERMSNHLEDDYFNARDWITLEVSSIFFFSLLFVLFLLHTENL